MFAAISSTLHAQTTPTLEWDANTETNIAGYRVYQGTQSGMYGSPPVDVGNVTSYRPLGVDWTHRAYFAVQAYNTSADVSPLSTEAVWVPPSITTFTGLTSSSPYPLAPGTSVTWTATASNNLGPVEYRFYLYKKTAWVMVQDYGPSNTYTWTPTPSDSGTPYFLQVWARAVGSTALSQSNNVVPRIRRGEAPGPAIPSNGASVSCTPSELRMIPLCAGHIPERIVA